MAVQPVPFVYIGRTDTGRAPTIAARQRTMSICYLFALLLLSNGVLGKNRVKTSSKTVFDYIRDHKTFSSFFDLLAEGPEVSSLLQDPALAAHAFFVPNNEAISRSQHLINSLRPLPGGIAGLLSYHIVPNATLPLNIEEKRMLSTALKGRTPLSRLPSDVAQKMVIERAGNSKCKTKRKCEEHSTLMIDNSSGLDQTSKKPKIQKVIRCTNGFVYVLDGMISPPARIPLFLRSSALSMFLDALWPDESKENDGLTIFLPPVAVLQRFFSSVMEARPSHTVQMSVDHFKAVNKLKRTHMVKGLVYSSAFEHGQMILSIDQDRLQFAKPLNPDLAEELTGLDLDRKSQVGHLHEYTNMDQDKHQSWSINGRRIIYADILTDFGVVHIVEDILHPLIEKRADPVE